MRHRTMAACCAAAILAAAFFASCSRIDSLKIRSASVPLGTELGAKATSAETQKLLELCRDIAAFSADRYGLKDQVEALRYLPGHSDGIAWRLTVAPAHSLKGARVSYYTDKAAAERAARKSEAKGLSAYVEPWDSLGFLGLAPTPLNDSLAKLSYDRLVEWINRELFSAAIHKGVSDADHDSFVAFAAEVATRDYLAAKLTPASPLLGNYISSKRDERTFALLFPDFRSRIENLYAQSPLPGDWQKQRDFLMKTWLQDYRLNYPNRFITNLYSDFGRVQPSDAELASWREQQPGYEDWNKRYAAAGSDLRVLLNQMGNP